MFDVRDKDHAYTEAIGIVELTTQHLLNGQVIDGWFPITKGNKVHRSMIRMMIMRLEINDKICYQKG